MGTSPLGEFEQAVLAAVLRLHPGTFALELRKEIEEVVGRPVSRGAFYTTLERLERKGLLTWEEAHPEQARRAGVQRRFRVTPAGVEALREAHRALGARWARLGRTLEEA